MKIPAPKKIKISAYTYKVKLEDDLMVANSNSGEHRPHFHEIVIDSRTTHKTQTFLHEVIHAINYSYHTGLDEDNTDRLASGIAELLQNLNVEIEW